MAFISPTPRLAIIDGISRGPPIASGAGTGVSPSFLVASSLAENYEGLMETLLHPETILGPLNSDTPEWLRTLVWTDFRLAVAFFVISPFLLLLWSAVECRPSGPKKKSLSADATLRVLTGYWQASSLLLITVMLNIVSSPVGVITGAVAQLMIVVSLNWWQSLNEEAETEMPPSSSPIMIGQAFGNWRYITSWVAGVGFTIQIPFLNCATQSSLAANSFCAPWLEPPQTVASFLAINNSLTLTEMVGNISLTIYVSYFLYYVCIPLPEIGRDGRAKRTSFTFVKPLEMLGFLEEER